MAERPPPLSAPLVPSFFGWVKAPAPALATRPRLPRQLKLFGTLVHCSRARSTDWHCDSLRVGTDFARRDRNEPRPHTVNGALTPAPRIKARILLGARSNVMPMPLSHIFSFFWWAKTLPVR